eukprot:gi/632974225/ref/XP_007903556.1/ PREDICTED: centrosomal protein POC5 isoform X2 [Callorhinchus milii]
MSSDEEGVGTPILPKDSDRGSSVSSDLQDEYEELLRYAVVTPKWDSHIFRHSHVVSGFPTDSRHSGEMEDVHCSFFTGSSSQNDVCRLGSTVRQLRTPCTNTQAPASPHSEATENLLEGEEHPQRAPIPSFLEAGSPVESPVLSQSVPSHVSIPNKLEMSKTVINRLPVAEDDMNRVEAVLDRFSVNLKSNILTELHNWRLTIIERHEKELKDEKEKHEVQIAQMDSQLKSMKDLACTNETSVERKEEVISNLIQGINSLKEKMELMRRFTHWRLQLSETKVECYGNALADKHYKMCLMRKVCTAWKFETLAQWKERAEKACQARAEEVCVQLSTDYEAKFKKLNEELEKSKAEIDRLLGDKDKYADSMKKAFMRGVCALNLEAMNMFQNGDRRVENENRTQPVTRKDDLDPSALTAFLASKQPATSVYPVPGNVDACDQMVTLHFGGANAPPSRATAAGTPLTTITVTSPSPAMGFCPTQKLPPGKVLSSAQQKAGKTMMARITGRSDLALKGVKCGNQGVAPPMTSVCVERHHPISQQTIGQATAAKYPRSIQPPSGSGGKVIIQSGKSSTSSYGIQSIKVVD